MNIHALMLADSAQAVDGKLYILGGAWNILRFPEFPAQLIVGIAVAIDVDWNETNTRHHLDVHFEDADGNRMDPTIGADFEFTGEGQSWTKFETLQLKKDKLVRTESSPMASFTYARCN